MKLTIWLDNNGSSTALTISVLIYFGFLAVLNHMAHFHLSLKPFNVNGLV